MRRATAEGAGLFVRSSPAFLRRHVALARDVIDTAVALQQDDDEVRGWSKAVVVGSKKSCSNHYSGYTKPVALQQNDDER